jgi:hypothetical protein
VAETLTVGAAAAGVSREELLERAVADDERQELLVRALIVAQDAAWQNKRSALGRAIANGVTGDDARLDEEMRFIRTVADLQKTDVHVLGLVAAGAQTAEEAARRETQLADAIPAILGQLETHGLVESRSPVTPGGAMTPIPRYSVTTLGRVLLERLPEGPS